MIDAMLPQRPIDAPLSPEEQAQLLHHWDGTYETRRLLAGILHMREYEVSVWAAHFHLPPLPQAKPRPIVNTPPGTSQPKEERPQSMAERSGLTIIEKRCEECHKIKPVALFHKAARSPDGYSKSCLACSKPGSATTPFNAYRPQTQLSQVSEVCADPAFVHTLIEEELQSETEPETERDPEPIEVRPVKRNREADAIHGLVDLLPESHIWDRREKEAWLTAFSRILDLCYPTIGER
jgi:hypothetical protein